MSDGRLLTIMQLVWLIKHQIGGRKYILTIEF